MSSSKTTPTYGSLAATQRRHSKEVEVGLGRELQPELFARLQARIEATGVLTTDG